MKIKLYPSTSISSFIFFFYTPVLSREKETKKEEKLKNGIKKMKTKIKTVPVHFYQFFHFYSTLLYYPTKMFK